MTSLTFAIVLAFVAVGSSLPLHFEWTQFKSAHGKQYVDEIEEAYRHGVWLKNRKYIKTHNEAYLKGEHSYYLGENEYADMTNEEFVKTMNGYRMRDSHGQNQVHQYDGDVTDLPTDVDWRTKGYVTPVKNQGQCGSCWAFSTTGSLEGQTFKKYNKLTSLSEQNLVDCSGPEGNKGCEGGLMDSAFKYIQKNGGLDTEASYPYKGVDGKCHFDKSQVGANLTGFVDVKSGDEGALQSAVATVGPISVAIDASHMSFQLYSGGIYHAWFCSASRLDHGVLAVGYGTDNRKQDFWMVKNSWGPSWGLKGYIMMSRNRSNNCGIATQASYPTV